MSFTLDPEVAATLQAIAEQNGPQPAPPPVGDVATPGLSSSAAGSCAKGAAAELGGATGRTGVSFRV